MCPRNAFRASRRNARVTVSIVGMENELSMNARAEVTTRDAKACVRAARGDKARILGEVVGGVPILLSSGFGMRGGEVSLVSVHGVEDVGLSAGEADERGVVPLALGSLAVVVGPGFWVGSQRCECGHEQGVLQALVASAVDVLAADGGARSPGDGREAGVGREVGGGGGGVAMIAGRA